MSCTHYTASYCLDDDDGGVGSNVQGASKVPAQQRYDKVMVNDDDDGNELRKKLRRSR